MLVPERHRVLSRGQAPLIDPSKHPVRQLTVVLDGDVVNAQTPEAAYLRRLLAESGAALWRYADAGPPDDERTLTNPHGGERYAPGWIELQHSGLAYSALLASEAGVTLASAWPGLQDISVAVRALGGQGTDDEKLADVLAACGASAAHPDAFVTGRQRLLATSSTIARQARPYDVLDALSLVGLLLRSQDRYVVGTEGDHMFAIDEVNRGLFYFVAARGLTPAGWRWFSACVDSGDESLLLLAQSVLERVDRSLRLRDTLYQWLLLPQNNDSADEALAALDALMFTLHGAFDAAARVAHRVLGLRTRMRDVGWHRQDWQGQVDKAGHHTLIDPVRAGTPGAALLQVIRSLRNTVHGEAVRTVAVHGSSTAGGVDTQLALPAEDVDFILAAIDAVGSRQAWGIRDFMQTRLLIQVPPFVEQIARPAYALLDELLRRTPVELLIGGRDPSITEPPTSDETFGPSRTRRILWQLGL